MWRLVWGKVFLVQCLSSRGSCPCYLRAPEHVAPAPGGSQWLPVLAQCFSHLQKDKGGRIFGFLKELRMPPAMVWDSPSFPCSGGMESSGNPDPASRPGGFILPSVGFSPVPPPFLSSCCETEVWHLAGSPLILPL